MNRRVNLQCYNQGNPHWYPLIPHWQPQKHTKNFLLNVASTTVASIKGMHEGDPFNQGGEGRWCKFVVRKHWGARAGASCSQSLEISPETSPAGTYPKIPLYPFSFPYPYKYAYIYRFIHQKYRIPLSTVYTRRSGQTSYLRYICGEFHLYDVDRTVPYRPASPRFY